MPYTSADAKREVGDSLDWQVGFRASLKKWEFIVAGQELDPLDEGYSPGHKCGFCFVGANVDKTGKVGCVECPADELCGKYTRGCLSAEDTLKLLRQLGKRKGWL